MQKKIHKKIDNKREVRVQRQQSQSRMTSLSKIPPKHDLRSDGPMATVKMSVNRKLLLFVEPQQITITQGISFSREQQATLEAGFTKTRLRDEGVFAFLSGIREIVTTIKYMFYFQVRIKQGSIQCCLQAN